MEMGGKKMSGFGGGFPGGNFGGESRSSRSNNTSGTSTDSKSAEDTSGGEAPAFGDFDPSNMPQIGDFDPSNMPQIGDFDPSNMPEGFGPGRETNDETKSSDDNSQAGSTGDTKEAGDSSDSSSDKASGRPEMPGGGKGGFSMGVSGANLNYTDDDLDSYSTIWDGEITETSKGDHRRVVTALKNISEGTDLEKYMDVDNILKYMAVHTFSVNMDSLSGTMAHNYYLYEYDGQLNIFPWDYNLSLGGMTMGSSGATDMVNDAIDTPFQSTEFFDALLENEEYLAKYHEYLNQLVEEYVYGGRFEEVYNRIRSQIDSLVDTDPTAFYSYDEYDAAAETLYETIQLRAESIRGQLDGTIPSTDDGQKQDSSNLVDASHIDVTVMGQFDMGGAIEKMNAEVTGEDTESESVAVLDATTAVINVSDIAGNSTLIEYGTSGGTVGEIDKQVSASTEENKTVDEKNASETSESSDSSDARPSFGPGGQGFGGGNSPDFAGMSGQTSNQTRNNLILFGALFAGMLIALVACKLIKRRKPLKKAESV
ncbi:MAG: CotH kinase family protein [Lachnospiraceae bacterium]|nr:CotH kinase family protein [Lachnospiraceae bacterium]